MFTIQQVTRGKCRIPLTAMGIQQFHPQLTCLYNVRDQTYAALPHMPLNDHAPKSES